MLIYGVWDKKLDKYVYIGQTNDFERRKQEELFESKKDKSKSKLSNYVRLNGLNNFEWRLLEDNISNDNIDDFETEYIINYKTFECCNVLIQSNNSRSREHGDIIMTTPIRNKYIIKKNDLKRFCEGSLLNYNSSKIKDCLFGYKITYIGHTFENYDKNIHIDIPLFGMTLNDHDKLVADYRQYKNEGSHLYDVQSSGRAKPCIISIIGEKFKILNFQAFKRAFSKFFGIDVIEKKLKGKYLFSDDSALNIYHGDDNVPIYRGQKDNIINNLKLRLLDLNQYQYYM